MLLKFLSFMILLFLLIGVYYQCLRGGNRKLNRASVSINLSSMPDPIEQDLITFDVITDTIISHTDTPLSNCNIRELDALTGIVLECIKRDKHAAMHLCIETPQVSPEAVGDNEVIARHEAVMIVWVYAASWSPASLLSGGHGVDHQGWQPFSS